MRLVIAYLRDTRGAGAAEFAMVLPVMLLFLLGIIDAGRFIWNVNQAEKATQIGARRAISTDMICSGLKSWSFSVNQSTHVPQGTAVGISDFPGVSYPGGSAALCSCASGGACEFPLTADTVAFTALVDRMNDIHSGIKAANVQVDYDWSGLGFSGDPNGPDVSPIITVRLIDLSFAPIFLGGIFDFGLPDLSYSLTMEDGTGTFSN